MSDDSEDDYAEFGTPLEPLDEDMVPRKKPFTIQEQFARDKQGRRRFHGAFTGGFSAGFLNTVGSLEGWTPTSFKSSKSEKGIAILQKPEQFMDEEDLGEFGIAPSVLHAKDDFSNNSNVKRKYSDMTSNSSYGSSVLKSLLQPVRETVGIKLLRKMGWKPGQGIGPRVTKHEKKRLSKMRKKVYGCSLPSQGEDSETEEEEDDELQNLTFAPHDYPFQLVTPKENVFGIGYQGLEKRSILSDAPQTKPELQERSRHTITGQAFGVGAFEEEDEDIYSREDMSQYDFTLNDSVNKDGSSASGHTGSEDLYDIFTVALKKAVKKIFFPPVVPKDFQPVHKIKISRFEPLPVTHDSQKLSQSPERKSGIEETKELQNEARKLTESAGGKCHGVFKPFISDIDKQSRYEKYMKLVMLGKKDDLSSIQPITMTDWEKEREQIEFEQASKLFKPLSGVMEDRFTVASQQDNYNDPLATVEKFKSGSEDEIKAAKMNMYGRLTRTVEDWKPSSLLCKRFNIPELNANEIPIVKNKPKYSIFDDMTSLKDGVKEECAKTHEEDNSSVVEKDKEIVEVTEPETSSLLNLPDPKNKIDLFNAIFLDTDSEEEEDSNQNEAKKEDHRYSETPYEENITNEKRNTSPARGIFENLDYTMLRSTKKTDENCAELSKESDKEVEKSVEENKLVYGPKIPDKLTAKKINAVIEPVIADSECWVEKTSHKKHKKHSKSSKKSKHKSKHKHKKSKR